VANTNLVTAADSIPTFLGSAQAPGGAGFIAGGTGTVVFITFPISQGAVFRFR
jgi:hypothetical protein